MKRMVIEKLQRGEDVIHRGKGNSMTPRIKSGQKVLLTPCTWEKAKVGDAVFCKVRGMITTHLVTAKNNEKGCQISNNHNYVNGWTKQVYGKVIKVL